MPADPDFLTRWSRRKAAARRAEDKPPAEPTPEREAAPVERADEPPSLPDPATLVAGSDFRAFMAEHVPGDLRRAALRRLWRVNPIINSLDGLDDHYVTQDFTDAATVVPGLRTTYRVGKRVMDAVDGLDRPEEAEDREPQPPAADAGETHPSTPPESGNKPAQAGLSADRTGSKLS